MLDLAMETSTDTSKSVREAPSRAHEHAAPLNNNTHITLGLNRDLSSNLVEEYVLLNCPLKLCDRRGVRAGQQEVCS